MTAVPPASRCILCAAPQAPRHVFGAWQVMYCRRCQLGQLAPLPSEGQLTALYGSRAYYEGTDAVGYADYQADAPQIARTFAAKLARLTRRRSVRALAEIGCGPGYLLDVARAAGIAEVVGVDRNPWAVEQARRRGLEAHVGSLEALPPGRAYDAVVMLDVLEHVPDPLPFLDAVRARLRPGGRILIMVPNIRSLLARLSGRRWVSFKIPEHVLYYSPRSIRLLLARAGLAATSVRAAGQYVTVAFALDRLARLMPALGAPLGALARAGRLAGRVVFVPNGSIDVVAAVAGREAAR
jgi:SAM-dependent methyltransferase